MAWDRRQNGLYALSVVEEFGSNVVIMLLGMNDLTAISAFETGSAIEDLCRLLYESYGVELICEHMTKMVMCSLMNATDGKIRQPQN